MPLGILEMSFLIDLEEVLKNTPPRAGKRKIQFFLGLKTKSSNYKKHFFFSDNAMIIDEVRRLGRAIDDWTFEIHYPNEMNISSEICRLRAIMDEVQSLALGVDDQNIKKSVEIYLKNCRKWS